MIADPLPLATTLAAVTALGLWLEDRFAWAAKVSASLLIILFGGLLSNLGLVTARSPVYGLIAGPVTSLAIVWLLLAVDLRDLKRAGPRMLLAFAIAAAATTLGAITAAALFGGDFPEHGWRLAGAMTGTYIGGSINFVAVGRAVELPDELFAAATAADNVMTALWMGATLLLPVWLRRLYPPPPEPDAGERDETAGGLLGAIPLRAVDLSLLLALGLLLLLAAQATTALLPAVPNVLWLTTYALAAAQLPPVRRLRGSLQLGTFALNLFFAVIGVGSVVAEILRVGVEVFYFTAAVVLIHGLITYAAARAARLDVETTSVASQAAVGGPSTAMALAIARRRPELVLPGMVVGLLGYAVGNYTGIAIAHFVRSW